MTAPSNPGLILVTGGTGTLGSHVVHRLTELGHAVRVLSRMARPQSKGIEYVVGDLMAGSGIPQAVAGASVIVHCASAPKGDVQATQKLVEVARLQPSPPHLIFISIVGVSGIRFGYFQEKLAAERVVTESGLAWTLQRATQFFDYLLGGAKSLTRFPIVPVPKEFRVQPIDPAEVAVRLAELAVGPPVGRVADIGGPEVTTWAEMTREYLRATNRRRPVVEVWLPMMKEIRAGALLVDRNAGSHSEPYGRTTWREFLERHLTREAVGDGVSGPPNGREFIERG